MQPERRNAQYYLQRFTVLIACALPRLLSYALARLVADIGYLLRPSMREGVKANLRVVLGPDAAPRRVDRMARSTFRANGEFLVDFLGFRRFGHEILTRQIEIAGLDALDRVVRGASAVLVSAHFSNLYLFTPVLLMRGYRVICMGLQEGWNLASLISHWHKHPNLEFVPIGQAMRRCVQAMRREPCIVWVTGDRPIGETGVEVEMFGHKTFFPQGPARMALHGGAALVPCFVAPRGKDSYDVRFEEPIDPPASGSAREKARAMTQAYARRLQNMVARFPQQWFLFYEVFDPPDGVAPDPLRIAFDRSRALATK